MSLVTFDKVSKQYRLGLSRTSLPALASAWARAAFGRRSQTAPGRDTIWAVRDVSFGLAPGESLALVGPNGAGKTTILKLMARITRPTVGRIDVSGRLSALIELGAGFHPDLTGRDNVLMNGMLLGLSRAEVLRRFDEIVAFADLERFIDTPVKKYSSGMAVRLGFAVAASVEPEVLLVDEVLAVGDAAFRKKCIDRIHELLAKGTSLVFVSHNLWLVQAVCGRALYVDQGRLVVDGTVSEVINRYERDVHDRRVQSLQRTAAASGVDAAEVEITGIELVSPHAVDEGMFPNTGQLEIRVHYVAVRDVGAMNCRVRIIRSDGVTCCMMRTKGDGFGLRLLQGAGVISLTVDPLQLYGGAYLVQAAIYDDTDSYCFHSKMTDPFYVKGSPLTHEELNGVFEPVRYWRHAPGEASGADGVRARVVLEDPDAELSR